MTLNNDQINDLQGMIDSALRQLYVNDDYLIKIAVNERAVVFRFGVYFYEILKSSSFSGFNLDAEYNKNLNDPKRMENFPKGIIPDILLHKRNENNHNILAIEFKGYWNGKNREKDHLKIKEFTNQTSNDPYRYGLGAVIEIEKTVSDIFYYINGIQV